MSILARLSKGTNRTAGVILKPNIGARLIVGFTSVSLVLVVAVGITQYEVTQADGITTRIVEDRVPTAFASEAVVRKILSSLASLRGWMLTGDPVFEIERAAAWADIAKVREDMDHLSQGWTNPEHVEK